MCASARAGEFPGGDCFDGRKASRRDNLAEWKIKLYGALQTKDWQDYGITGAVNVGRPLQAAPYHRLIERKTAAAKIVLADFFALCGDDSYVSLSFGVDSLVAYHLARMVKPDVRAVWVNQGPLAEWPDCLALKDQMVADGLPLVELAPDITLYDWYRQHGIPIGAGMGSADDERLNEALMYAPLNRWMEAESVRGIVWGLRGTPRDKYREGKHREILLCDRGELFQRKTGAWVCSPVAWWSKREIFAFLDLHALLYPAMYDVDREQVRNGPPIGASAMNMGRMNKMKLLFPAIWRVVVYEFPELQRFG